MDLIRHDPNDPESAESRAWSRAEKFGENTDASPMAAAAAAATAARIAAAEAQNAEYREAKILQTDGNTTANAPG
jgi:hypothetical protein